MAEVKLTGDVPSAWYRSLAHVGYNSSSQRLLRPDESDKLSNLLAHIDDRSLWRKISNELTGTQQKLTTAEVLLLQKIQAGTLPSNPVREFAATKSEVVPFSPSDEPKRRFRASAWEARAITKLVRSMRARSNSLGLTSNTSMNELRDIWDSKSLKNECEVKPIRARKSELPGNELSLNPPAEYTAYSGRVETAPRSLRSVAVYDSFVKEKFERCLDLYLCPRSVRHQVNIDPESLLPSLPLMSQLRPYPELCMQEYGVRGPVSSISVHGGGEWIASCDISGSLSLFDIQTGRCLNSVDFGCIPTCVSWQPGTAAKDLVVCFGSCVAIFNPFSLSNVDSFLTAATNNKSCGQIVWERIGKEAWLLHHPGQVQTVRWHNKGGYLSTIFDNSRRVAIHNISMNKSQEPFNKQDGKICDTLFHPIKPMIFVCSQRGVRLYNLKTQELEKRFVKGMGTNKSFSLSSDGTSLLVGTNDGKLICFDTDISNRGKVMAVSTAGVGCITCHNEFSLFATASYDGSVHVFHLSGVSEFTSEPVITPVISVKNGGASILGDCLVLFHPTQPWLFSQGGNDPIKLYCPNDR
jgi:ribosome biogenesis protein ERB1